MAMAPSTTSPLENLPLLVLERVCEYLDDESEERHSLWAFSLASRCCCAAAATQRFCQIQLSIPTTDELESFLRRWTEVLSPDGCYRHVRRLKLLKVVTEKQRREKDLQMQKEEAEDVEHEDEGDCNRHHYFDMHHFCRPFKDRRGLSRAGMIEDYPETWVPLARLISQLPGLKDLVWACGSYMPRSVLSAVHAGGCRLHMHDFRLRSLIQTRGSPQPISPDDYALATSPSLSSIVVPFGRFDGDGALNYTEEAVLRIVAGMAPSLAHVCMVPANSGSSLALSEAVRLGRPAWCGFFPGTAEADKLPVLGSIRSLAFTSYVPGGIETWGFHTDFTRLHRLSMPWRTECSFALAEIALRGDFKSLDTLELFSIDDETDQAQEILNRLLENLNPLQRLYLTGYISSKTFDIILHHHGKTLHELLVHPYGNEELLNPLVVFSEVVVQRFAEQCTNLEHLWLWVNRTRGDDQETGSYRALSRLPRLRRAFLRLWYSIGPYEEYWAWDRENDGENPMEIVSFIAEIPIPYLREAFTNSAIDAPLALSIFNLISSGGSLRYLRLQIYRKATRLSPLVDSVSGNVLEWFNRWWVCKRDARGRVTVRDLHCKGTDTIKMWKYMSKDRCYHGEEVFEEVFKDIWPPRTEEWWNDWKSLPLSSG